ncbi:HD domain-containing phosphohydrolase [Rhodocyclus tenuis]|uniref:HD domain-containing phosphohydrolase n=1 Tax=Rhodocyclus tenuis TaxID=1066 RepID=UPI001905D565|nr:HD domain-containing phosphohydrolase [Rhodocyclus tenuis]MBK1680657.1 PAS sensor protein [Rhodocyclus tenuis]
MIESQLQAALRFSESRYRRLFETAQDGILLLNAETAQIEDVNPFLIELLGYSHAEFLGKKVWEIGAFKDTALNIDAFVELRSKRYIRYDDLPLETRDGRRISVEFVSNLYDCAGVNVIQCNIRDNTKRHLAEIALRATARALQMLSESNVALLRATSEPTLFAEYCRIAVETGGYRMAWIGFAGEGSGQSVRAVAHFGQDDGLPALAGASSGGSDDGPVDIAIRSGQVQFVEDITINTEMAPWRSAALAHGYRSMIALPFRFADDTVACLCLCGTTRDLWSAPERKLLQEISADLAFGINALRTAIAKTHYQESLRVSLEQTIQVIADTVEERDAYTAGHQRRVAQLSSRIASELGLSAERVRGLHLAATIHDLGKVGIPSEILSKPRRLSTMEFGLMKEHPQIGYEILKNVDFPWPIARIIQQHHERIDGSGYPDGLLGDALLLESRILAVADVVEAMASHRPYRAALGLDAALKEVSAHRGITFDSAVVDACLRIFREHGFTIED